MTLAIELLIRKTGVSSPKSGRRVGWTTGRFHGIGPRAAGLTGLVPPRTVRRSLFAGTANRSHTRAMSARPHQIWEPSRDEAYLPAQQPASQPDARVSPPDADPGRTGHFVGPSAQGSRVALGLSGRDH